LKRGYTVRLRWVIGSLSGTAVIKTDAMRRVDMLCSSFIAL
jgi:hypothetical protein